MTNITDESDHVVGATSAVLEAEALEGTQNIRRGTEDDPEFVYRVEPDDKDSQYVDRVSY